MTRRLLATFALACGVVLTSAGVARASTATAMGVQIDNAQVTRTGTSGDACAWQVSSEVTVVNRTNAPRHVTAVSANVSWTAPDGSSGVVRGVQITDNGGLEPGVVLNANEDRTFSPFVTEFQIPCKADFGDLAAFITTANDAGTDAQTNSGDAAFLENGTSVPVGALGALGLAAGVGAVFGVRQWRRRRHPSGALTPAA